MSGASPIRTFFDTNVLIYTDDLSNFLKQKRALEVLNQHKLAKTGVLSLQVLQEYFVTVTRKYGVDPGVARRKVELFAAFDVVEPALSDVLAAIDLHQLRRLSYWDALIVHTAKQSGCPVVLSEDMQHGQVIDGVRIVNPFL
ncbi:MAG: PIN domain-containing protein [Terracidiphilus sp.]|nr:PIN domain-containing protein [Terracidiphilus sp.]MDR3799808.1 PIN domain-containing protein [Terracidiphilus sp.]